MIPLDIFGVRLTAEPDLLSLPGAVELVAPRLGALASRSIRLLFSFTFLSASAVMPRQSPLALPMATGGGGGAGGGGAVLITGGGGGGGGGAVVTVEDCDLVIVDMGGGGGGATVGRGDRYSLDVVDVTEGRRLRRRAGESDELGVRGSQS